MLETAFLIPLSSFSFILPFFNESPAVIKMREAESVPARAEALPPPGVGVEEERFFKKHLMSMGASNRKGLRALGLRYFLDLFRLDP
jgi:hypothetical protein